MVKWKIYVAPDLPPAVIEDTEDGMEICEIANPEHYPRRDDAPKSAWEIAREIVESHNAKEGKVKVKFELADNRYNQVQETLQELSTNFPFSASRHASTVQRSIKTLPARNNLFTLEVDEVAIQNLLRLIGDRDLIPNPMF